MRFLKRRLGVTTLTRMTMLTGRAERKRSKSNHDSKNCSGIKTVTWSVIWLWKLQFTILTFSHRSSTYISDGESEGSLPPWSFQLLEYQWPEGEFKQTSSELPTLPISFWQRQPQYPWSPTWTLSDCLWPLFHEHAFKYCLPDFAHKGGTRVQIQYNIWQNHCFGFKNDWNQ